MHRSALSYLHSGLSVIPVSPTKRSTIKWEPYQTVPMDPADCERHFRSAWGIALVSGPVSGGLEVIDFDAHEHDIGDIFNRFMAGEEVSQIFARYEIPVERSPRGGYHIIYRYESDTYEGNRKLANWPDGQSMIETRGQGGYTIVHPSPGYDMQNGSLLNIPTISKTERDSLITQAKKLNQSINHSVNQSINKSVIQSFNQSVNHQCTDPVSYFNWHCQPYAKNLLEESGWKLLSTDPTDQIEYWQRPGKEGRDHSATWGHRQGMFYVFSSSAPPFQNECYYSPFQILVLLRFNGAWQQAACWIGAKYLNESDHYVRVGTDYFRIISKTDRFGIRRTELKPWKLETLKQDYGKIILDKINRFDDFTIRPDNRAFEPVIDNCYNLYRPFTHQPQPGPWPWTELLVRHIFGEQYELGIRYLQILYLHPDRLMPILVLVSRERQTGKTTFLNWLSMIFGDNMAMVSPDDLVNGFNSTYASSNIIAVEETIIEKNVTVEKIKALATQKFISVNQKYVTQYRTPFFGKIILTSNNEDKFARIDDEEIRFFIRKVGIPSVSNHRIEADLVGEIPAFLHHLTSLPPVDFSIDRTGFTPAELQNTSLNLVRHESKSGLYRSMFLLFEDLFLNELAGHDRFLADVKAIRQRFFDRDPKVDLAYIRQVLRNEFKLSPMPDSVYFNPFVFEPGKQGRPYLFERAMFTGEKSTPVSLPF